MPLPLHSPIPNVIFFGRGRRFCSYFFLCVDNGKKKEPTCLTRPAHRRGAGEAHVCILYLVLERKAVGLQESAYLPSVSLNGCFSFVFSCIALKPNGPISAGCASATAKRNMFEVFCQLFSTKQHERPPDVGFFRLFVGPRKSAPFPSLNRTGKSPRDGASAYLPSMTPTRQCHVGLVGSIDVCCVHSRVTRHPLNPRGETPPSRRQNHAPGFPHTRA